MARAAAASLSPHRYAAMASLKGHSQKELPRKKPRERGFSGVYQLGRSVRLATARQAYAEEAQTDDGERCRLGYG